MADKLGEALGFTESDLRRIADARSSERGLGYLYQVADLRIASSRLTPTGFGNDAHEVSLEYGTDRPGRQLVVSGSVPSSRGQGFGTSQLLILTLVVVSLLVSRNEFTPWRSETPVAVNGAAG